MAAALRDGAATRPLRLGDSAMPGDMALSMILWEYQVHGWDLARATGQPWSPPAEAAEESLEFAPGMLTDDYQGEGKAFAPRVRVPATAPPLDRLLGLSGRDPAWPGHPGGGSHDAHRPVQGRWLRATADQRPGRGLGRGDTFAKTFTSGIIGSATTVFMSAGTEEGSRSYVATDRITGRTEDGREGSVTVQHGGLDRTRIPGSATSCPPRAPAGYRLGPTGQATDRPRRPGSLTSRSPWPDPPP